MEHNRGHIFLRGTKIIQGDEKKLGLSLFQTKFSKFCLADLVDFQLSLRYRTTEETILNQHNVGSHQPTYTGH